ncbi:MAG: hypothetical protein HY720_02055 [Planctomycetes bacterium]|nr:hypothetical protein [Planctomycetota bacterium]
MDDSAPELVRAREEDEARPASVARYRLGDLAVFNGLLNKEHLEECLAIQADLGRRGLRLRLGKILLLKFYVDRPSLTALLKAQVEGAGLPLDRADLAIEVVKFRPEEQTALARRIHEGRLVSPGEIDQAVELQVCLAEHGIDLEVGEVLLEMGVISRDVVMECLERRTIARKRLPKIAVEEEAPDILDELENSGFQRAIEERVAPERLREARRFRLGRLAVLKGGVAKDEIVHSLVLQLRLKELGVRKRLGEILVDRGVLVPAALARLLEIQKRNLSRIRWSDQAEGLGLTEEDRQLARALIDNEILAEDQVRECCYVQEVMAKLGLAAPLSEVLTDKEYMDADVVAAIERGLAGASSLAEPGEAAAGGRSGRLQQAYEEILSHARFKHLVTSQFRRVDLTEFRPPVRGDSIRARPRREALRTWFATLAVSGPAVAITLFAWFLPHLLEAPPLPPSPPRPSRKPVATYDTAGDESLAGDSSLSLEGRVQELAVYAARGDGSNPGSFDFILTAGNRHYVVRGELAPGGRSDEELERLANEGASLRVRGRFRKDDALPPSPLPDGTWTKEYVALESWEVAGKTP